MKLPLTFSKKVAPAELAPVAANSQSAGAGEIVGFFEKLNLSDYAAAFQKYGITSPAEIKDLADDDWTQLKVSSFHKKKILASLG